MPADNNVHRLTLPDGQEVRFFEREGRYVMALPEGTPASRVQQVREAVRTSPELSAHGASVGTYQPGNTPLGVEISFDNGRRPHSGEAVYGWVASAAERQGVLPAGSTTELERARTAAPAAASARPAPPIPEGYAPNEAMAEAMRSRGAPVDGVYTRERPGANGRTLQDHIVVPSGTITRADMTERLGAQEVTALKLENGTRVYQVDHASLPDELYRMPPPATAATPAAAAPESPPRTAVHEVQLGADDDRRRLVLERESHLPVTSTTQPGRSAAHVTLMPGEPGERGAVIRMEFGDQITQDQRTALAQDLERRMPAGSTVSPGEGNRAVIVELPENGGNRLPNETHVQQAVQAAAERGLVTPEAAHQTGTAYQRQGATAATPEPHTPRPGMLAGAGGRARAVAVVLAGVGIAQAAMGSAHAATVGQPTPQSPTPPATPGDHSERSGAAGALATAAETADITGAAAGLVAAAAPGSAALAQGTGAAATAGRAVALAGRAAGPLAVVAGGAVMASQLADGDHRGATGTAVGMGGALAGAQAGAALGAMAGPVGAVVGGFAGGVGGYVAGTEIGQRAHDLMTQPGVRDEQSAQRVDRIAQDRENQALMNSPQAERALRMLDNPRAALPPELARQREEIQTAERAMQAASPIAQPGQQFSPRQEAEMAFNGRVASFVRTVNGDQLPNRAVSEPAASAGITSSILEQCREAVSGLTTPVGGCRDAELGSVQLASIGREQHTELTNAR